MKENSLDGLHETLTHAIDRLNAIRDAPLDGTFEEPVESGIKRAMQWIGAFHDKNDVAQTQRMAEVSPRSAVVESLGLAGRRLITASQDLLEVMKLGDGKPCRAHLETEELGEQLLAMANGDEVEVLDALADRLYVLLGTAVMLDLPLAEAFCEVHRSNMTKEKQKTDPLGERIRDKGPNYKPPDIAGVLATYRVRQATPHFMVDGECKYCGKSQLEVFQQIRELGKPRCTGSKL